MNTENQGKNGKDEGEEEQQPPRCPAVTSSCVSMSESDRPVKMIEKNFKTLRKAIRNDDDVLVECILNATGERVAAICAANMDDDGGIEFVPFAVMLMGNPYELLTPPARMDDEPDYELQEPQQQGED